MVDHIIPALLKGRAVYAYIEGLDHQRISEASGLPIERVRELLHQITREQVPTIYDHVKNDSMVVIDELQNFWPSGRGKRPDEVTKFVAEHRHRGLDLLCMGQVLNDCHALWKGRIDTLILFRKLDSIGKPDEYQWSVQKRNGKQKFQEVTAGKKKYEERYFGCYASHTEDTENVGSYVDDRANVKNSKAFKLIKVYGFVFLVAVGFVVYFFGSGGAGLGQKKPDLKAVNVPSAVDPAAVAAAQNAKATGEVVQTPSTVGKKESHAFDGSAHDYIDELAEKGRIRLTGTLRTGSRMVGTIEWRDSSNRVYERFTLDQLQGLGWFVMVSADGGVAMITKPGKSYVATSWPLLDDRSAAPERVPTATNDYIRSEAKPADLAMR